MITQTNEIPTSLYIHIPWCLKKCPYCDFNSVPCSSSVPEKKYIEALLMDLQNDIGLTRPRILKSIFIGGGTPSIFSPRSIEKLLQKIAKVFSINTDIEITMEANPATFNKRKMKKFLQAGINRLSIGIQSFQDDKLKSLGRLHNSYQAKKAIEFAYNAGFTNINLDLMHGLPNQTVEDSLFDLETALQFEPQHLSWYQLTIEPETLFAKKTPVLPNEEALYEIEQAGHELLSQHQYEHYETSAYCKKNFECQHNLNYWQFGDYFGIGAGAHSKLTHIDPENNFIMVRLQKTNNPVQYLKDEYIDESNIISKKDLPLEFMMNALRLMNGVPTTLFSERTGLPLEFIKPQLEKAFTEGFIEDFSERIRPTPFGQKFLNECLNVFIDNQK